MTAELYLTEQYWCLVNMKEKIRGSYSVLDISENSGREIQRLNSQVDIFWKNELEYLCKAGLKDGMSIVEFGSGPGYVSKMILDSFPNCHITQVEIDPYLIKFSNKYLHENGYNNFDQINCSISDTPFPDNSFDFSFARLVLEHVPTPIEAVQEVRRVLKKNGKAIFIDNDFGIHLNTYPVSKSLPTLYESYCISREQEGGSPRIGRQLPSLLKEGGFINVDLELEVAHSDIVGKEAFLASEGMGIPKKLMQDGFLDKSDLAKISSEWSEVVDDDEGSMFRIMFMAAGEKDDAVFRKRENKDRKIKEKSRKKNSKLAKHAAKHAIKDTLINDVASLRESIVSLENEADKVSFIEKVVLSQLSQLVTLGEQDIDGTMDFSELGLSSLLGVKLIKQLNETFEINMGVEVLFDVDNCFDLAKYICQIYQKTPVSENTYAHTEKMNKSPLPDNIDRDIAIIGMSGRFPGAKNINEFWENLEKGANSISEVNRDNWDINRFFSENEEENNKAISKWGGFLDDIDCFDPKFFNITPSEAKYMDPQQRIFLEEAYRVFEDASHSSETMTEKNVGVFVGARASEYLSQSIATDNINSKMFLGNDSAILASRLSYFLNLKGPCWAIDTACSSSLVALHNAVSSLRSGECDFAVAGGVFVMSSPQFYILSSKTQMLSVDGKCKTFDNSANGIVPGEAVGVFLLRPLKDAIEDNDNIHAVIKGSAINQDGKTKGITAPSAKSQSALIKNAFNDADMPMDSVQYMELHGTGTKLGDPIEFAALKQAFSGIKNKNYKILVGSHKPNIGHTIIAAGMAGAIKVVESIKNKKIPPTINIDVINEHLDVSGSPFDINQKLSDWNVENGEKRTAGVSSFGFSGTNAHILLQEAPEKNRKVAPKNKHILAFSARSQEQLVEYIKKFVTYVQNQISYNIGDISYSLMTGRKHHDFRLTCLAENIEQLVSILNSWLVGDAVGGIYTGKIDKNNLDSKLTGLGNEAVSRVYNSSYESVLLKDLDKISELYSLGYPLDYSKLYSYYEYHRLSLPTCDYSRDRYWISSEPKSLISPSITKDNENNTQIENFLSHSPEIKKSLFFVNEWKQKDIHVKDKKIDSDQTTKKYLILFDTTQTVETRSDIELVLSGFGIELVNLKNSSYHDKFEDCCVILFETLQVLLNNLIAQKIHLQVVVVGKGLPFLNGLSSLIRSVEQESSKLYGQVISIDEPIELKKLGALLNNEKTSASDKVVWYDNGDRKIPQWHEQVAAQPIIPWRDGGRYVISGGWGGLGQIIAQDILTKSHNSVVLILGRSSVNDSQISDFCQKFKVSRQRISYYSVDVSNVTLVESAVSTFINEFGGINGVIHAAGLILDNYLRHKKIDEVRAVLKPKVVGVDSLDRATSDLKLDFFVLFSSIAASLGNAGQLDYAAANGYLDGYAYHRNAMVDTGARYGKTVSINWPLWEDGGMQVDEETRHFMHDSVGLVPMDTKTGITDLYRAIGSVNNQVMVLTGVENRLRDYVNREELDEAFSANQEVSIYDEKTLLTKSVLPLKTLFGKVTELKPHDLDLDTPFDKFGIDSIMITSLNRELSKHYRNLPKTLFYEYLTLNSLVKYLVSSHPEETAKWSNVEPKTTPKITKIIRTEEEKYSSETVREKLNSSPLNEKETVCSGDKSNKNKEPFAIIGLSGRYPSSANIDQYWELIRSGKSAITEIPEERWSLDNFYDPNRRRAATGGKSYSKWGGFVDDFACFDPLFFGISPREARDMDPQERLFIESCWAAFEDSGYSKKLMAEHYHGRVGVFAGITKTGFDLHGPKMQSRNPSLLPHTSFGSLANRVSYLLDLCGPSMTIDTMCSSSLVAIHEACEHIYRGECDIAIAGGVNLYLHPSNYVHLCAHQMLSSDGLCRSFGESGNGFVPGEGVGSVILKPLSKAKEDHDHIYAVIRGSAANHGGKTNGYTVPSPTAQAKLVRNALDRSNLNAREINYIEAHGTGTELGDPIEISGLQTAFSSDTNDTQFCSIGSVKSNIGHLEAAAGIAAVTKVILQMKHQEIAPTLHARELNPNIDFERSAFLVAQELCPWNRIKEGGEEKPLKSGVSSFGAGGTNAHVILEEHLPSTMLEIENEKYLDQKTQVFIFSAKSEDRLSAMVKNFHVFLTKNIKLQDARVLRNIAYTLQVGRDELEYRLAIIAENYDELIGKLAKFLDHSSNIDDGVFHGNTEQLDTLKILLNDLDFRKTVSTWVNEHKFDILAPLWVKGMSISWTDVYADKSVMPYRISLPTYPFERNHYWIDSETIENNSGATEYLHPMVHENVSTLNSVQFRTLISGSDFYVEDHVVQMKKVLPGVAYLEMARSAANMAGIGEVTTFRNILWSSALVVSDQVNVRTTLSRSKNGVRYSIETGSDHKVIHSQGEILVSKSKINTLMIEDTKIISERCQNIVSGEEIYTFLKKLRFSYGPSFKVLTQVSYNDRELLSEYQLPEVVVNDFEKYKLHPSIMDGALQATAFLAISNSLESSEEIVTQVPFSVLGLHVFSPICQQGYVYTKKLVDQSGNGSNKYDIKILDKFGNCCVFLNELSIRAISLDEHKESKNSVHENANNKQYALSESIVLAEPKWEEEKQLIKITDNLNDLSDINATVFSLGKFEQEIKDFGTGIECDWRRLEIKENRSTGEQVLEYAEQILGEIKGVLQGNIKSKRIILILTDHNVDKRLVEPLHAILKVSALESKKIMGLIVNVHSKMTHDYSRLKQLLVTEFVSVNSNNNIINSVENISYDTFDARRIKRFNELTHSYGDLKSDIKGVIWITGGLGGLGKIFSKHLSTFPGITLILSGRSKINEEDTVFIESLKKPDVKVEYVQLDVCNFSLVNETVLAVKEKYGDINGIIHSAGKINDGLIVNKDFNDFKSVASVKSIGTENLDKATRSMKLDFFVMFSSISSIVGNIGQVDYGFANAYIDAFSTYRKKLVEQGLRHGKTVSINWPLWKEGGMQIDESNQRALEKNLGITSLSTENGIAVLNWALSHQSLSQVVVLDGNRDLIKKRFHILPFDLSHNSQKNKESELTTHIEPEVNIGNILGSEFGKVKDSGKLNSEGNIGEIQRQLITTISEILSIDVDDITVDGEFSDFGLDSIRMISILNRLEDIYDISLDPSSLMDYPSIEKLSSYLISQDIIIESATDNSINNEPTLPSKVVDGNEEVFQRTDVNELKPSAVTISNNEVALELVSIFSQSLSIDLDKFKTDVDFSTYGLDSIRMMQILNDLEDKYDIAIDPSAISDYPTINKLSNYLIGQGLEVNTELTGKSNADVSAVKPSALDVNQAKNTKSSTSTIRPMRSTKEDDSLKVAIIGSSCRLPQSSNAEELWENLISEKHLVTEIPSKNWRWDHAKYFSKDKSKHNKTYSNHGGFLKDEDIFTFDSDYFGMSENDSIAIDPQHRIMLEMSRELLDNAGFSKEKIEGTNTSVWLGSKENFYLRNNYEKIPRDSINNVIVNTIGNMMAARVSDFYNLKGTSKTIDTACSSSLVAIHDACRGIISGENDMAISGGIFLLMDEFAHIGFSQAKVIDESGVTRVFDERANGFAMAEGAGLVLLKRYDQAIKDGDNIQAVINTSTVNNDGNTLGLTTPSMKGQIDAIERTINKSKINPELISMYEAHGTGTLLGDPIEVKAASEAYKKHTSLKGYCAIGSIKSNLGHTMTAAGVTSLMKILLSLKHKKIPSTLHCETPHRRFRFDKTPFFPNVSLRDWDPVNGRRIAALSSLGFGGTNCHMIIEEH